MISRELKEQLKTLSKEVLGSSSRWQKILENGTTELLTEEVTEYVPGEKDEDEGTTRQVRVPVKRNNMHVSVVKHYTPQELLHFLLEMKTRREMILAQLKKAQEDAETKKREEEYRNKVASELSGSFEGLSGSSAG